MKALMDSYLPFAIESQPNFCLYASEKVQHDFYLPVANVALAVTFLLVSSDYQVEVFLPVSQIRDQSNENGHVDEDVAKDEHEGVSHHLCFLLVFHLPFFHIHNPFFQSQGTSLDQNKEVAGYLHMEQEAKGSSFPSRSEILVHTYQEFCFHCHDSQFLSHDYQYAA